VSASNSGESTYARASWLFLRLLGVVYLVAFWSLWTQILGLIGHNGILPADRLMRALTSIRGFERFWIFPTLTWISVSDSSLRLLCGGGMVLSLFLIAGLLPILVVPLLWLFYLSLSVVGQDFLSYQWDALLLETGFLAIFLSPLTVREKPAEVSNPPRVMVWLFLWLLFRLMVGSGVVKLASGDPTWHSLTALSYHFETQPIPTPLAWYAAHLPTRLLKFFTALTLGIEIGAPFLIPTTRRLRELAFLLLAGLQFVIALTGNYAFFNVLSVGLCLFLLDDVSLGRWTRLGVSEVFLPHWRRVVTIGVAVVTVPLSVAAFAGSLGIALPIAPLVNPVVDDVASFRSVNAYGLFAVMTTTRPEIVVEGSDDGTNWIEYEFKYKAGDLHRRPPWVAPHQPRLDWQMWFAALGGFEEERWFQDFCVRLLENDSEVLSLIARNPFPAHAPKYLRALLYRYRFSTADARRRDGVSWTRELVGDYSPVLSLQDRRESGASAR
jgi:lipase maturation factor 1